MLKQITVDELRPGMFIHKLEVWWIKDTRIHNQMLVTDPRQIEMLRNEGIQQLWIDLNKSLQAPAAPPPAKKPIDRTPFFQELDQAQKIFQQGKPQVMAMFNEARLGHGLNLAGMLELVDEIAGSIRREPTALLSVARLKNHDDYTWLHSMAVCGLMINLAQQLGLDNRQVLRVGMGGLLHDVGKAAVPLEILNKPGKLTEEEFEVMRQHPVTGAQMLMEANAEADLLDIALHHHEKYDGSGYPHRLKGEEISFYSRMAAVCDVYDALTSTRVYRKGWSPAEAMHNMLSWRGHFDNQILYTFVRAIGIYPVGSLVRLASGRVALVVKAGERSLLKPVVHAFWSLHAQREVRPERIDLGDSFCTDSIIGAEEGLLWENADLNRVWALAS
ncbi:MULTISPECIES: HD-GYP domain-containing protein [Pantoea]|uniref:HD-GYP domain-containing protein n=1 Tax=Pantoea TaxID=53335 RepID=UPI000EA3C630|nr:MULTISPECIES: HD-GYP domain-containing protein [Pantoea]MDU6432931.1 HD-GYP domain-containing protein [Pantoea sp.]MBZ6386749.1 HD-GYP domain-containing protein [Pantoea piersonii]MBZ6399573.1 HD-GYP domain-containing protein [Pantoea piersonii]MBZ6410310.1 HD-GYP domain-containing protein [Pantoea piersonii]MBZ6425592.1 HD-GYP domain-containing protein [Pantoea piersonii]